MRKLRELIFRFGGLLNKQRKDRELDDEIESHLQMHIEDNLRLGMTPEEARREAMLKLGGIESTKEAYRDQRGLPVLETLWQDIRYGARMLRKSPCFTSIAVLTLALGIGANTTIFSVVNAVLLEPLPYADSDRLVSLSETRPEAGGTGLRVNVPVSPATFIDWRNEVRSFEQIAAVDLGEFVYTSAAEPEQLIGASVSANLFPMLGVAPRIGRNFLPEEDRPGAGGVALLSHSFWQRRFGANPSVIGQVITLDGRRVTIIGVLPSWFDSAAAAGIARLPVEIWIPLGLVEAGVPRAVPAFDVHARLKAGATLAAAQAEVDVIMQRLAKEFPETNATRGAQVQAIVERVVGDVRLALSLLFAAVGLVLLMACANMANLLLVRASLRSAETATRAALGANRSRLIRQFLTESLLLAGAGCAVGLFAAAVSIGKFSSLLSSSLPRAERIEIDGQVLAFTVVASLLTGLIFGLAPAWRSANADLHATLQATGRRGGGDTAGARLRHTLVVTQVALSLVLLVGAGLLLKSFVALSGVDRGFDAHNVLTLRINLAEDKYATPAKRSAFFEQLLPQVQAVPGVESAATIFPLPFSASILNRAFAIPGQPSDPAAPLAAQYNIVSPECFRTLGIRITKGRVFTERDRTNAPLVAIINETMARRIWQGENPLGKRLAIGLDRAAEREVIGVFADIKQRRLDSEPRLQVCVSSLQQPVRTMYLVVRGTENATTLLPSIRQRIATLDHDQPFSDVALLSERVAGSIAQHRFVMLLLAVFATTALLLAVGGLSGVISYTVAQRKREFGIRIALGAQNTQIFGLVLRQGLTLAGLGIALGLAGASAATRFFRSLLFGISPTDPLTFLAIPFLLALVALLACWLPATTKVDPMEALR